MISVLMKTKKMYSQHMCVAAGQEMFTWIATTLSLVEPYAEDG